MDNKQLSDFYWERLHSIVNVRDMVQTVVDESGESVDDGCTFKLRDMLNYLDECADLTLANVTNSFQTNPSVKSIAYVLLITYEYDSDMEPIDSVFTDIKLAEHRKLELEDNYGDKATIEIVKMPFEKVLTT